MLLISFPWSDCPRLLISVTGGAKVKLTDTPVGTALLPTLSRQAQTGDRDGAIATLNRALEYALAQEQDAQG